VRCSVVVVMTVGPYGWTVMLFVISRVNRFLHFGKRCRRWEKGDWDSYSGNPLGMTGCVSESDVHPDAERNGVEKSSLSN